MANDELQKFILVQCYVLKKPLRIMRNRKKTTKKRFFSRADEKRFCIGSAECYVTIINKTDAKVISSDTDDWVKTSFRQI